MKSCESSERGRALEILADFTERTGFESALATVDETVRRQTHDVDSQQSLYRRLFKEAPELPPLDSRIDGPMGNVIPFHIDLSAYDAALKGGVLHG
jgi:hypothetical protein